MGFNGSVLKNMLGGLCFLNSVIKSSFSYENEFFMAEPLFFYLMLSITFVLNTV